MVIDALSHGGQDRRSCLRQMALRVATKFTRSYIELVIGGTNQDQLRIILVEKDLISGQHLVSEQLMELRENSWQG